MSRQFERPKEEMLVFLKKKIGIAYRCGIITSIYLASWHLVAKYFVTL